MRKIILLVFLAGAVGIIVVIQQIALKLLDETSSIEPPAVVVATPSKPKPVQAVQADDEKQYAHRIFLDPSRKFELHTILLGNESVATYKTDMIRGKVYDFQGAIPDVDMEFRYTNTGDYGTESFRNGKRHGNYKEFYKTGEKKREAYYYYGKLMQRKEYFIDGTLRMEEDYTDAIEIEDRRHIGEGKVYFRNGAVRYEWSFTLEGNGGYDRSYDQEGGLRSERIFDAEGNITKEFYR